MSNIFKVKYKKAIPHIIDEIAVNTLIYNKNNPRNFLPCYRVLSFAFDGSTLITIGENKKKTHPRYKDYADDKRLSIHAEIDMILKLERMNAMKKITDIVLIRGTTKLLDSFPCSFCYPNLKKYFSLCRLWFYSNDDFYMKVIS